MERPYQKILPKFHGSEAKLKGSAAKLKEPLTVVHEFCKTYGYTRSLAKIEQMLQKDVPVSRDWMIEIMRVSSEICE